MASATEDLVAAESSSFSKFTRTYSEGKGSK
jgi:hypothetical protein